MKKIFLILLCFVALKGHAHPHEWMNIVLSPEINAQHQIVALNQEWAFDPLYAQILLEPVLKAKTQALQKQAMEKISAEITQTLAQKAYYTFPTTLFAGAEKQHLLVREGILYYQFRLFLKKPVSQLSFSIYEPSYYVEMRYDEEAQLTHFSNGCQLKIQESQPDPKMVQMAYAIDVNGKAPENLGKYFAQRSVITCKPA